MNERVTQFEEAFKKRYNRDIEVQVEQEVSNGKLVKVKNTMKYRDKIYTIEEFLDENGLTNHVFAEADGKTHKYLRFLEAEVYVADCIGEQDGNRN